MVSPIVESSKIKADRFNIKFIMQICFLASLWLYEIPQVAHVY
jgi:hypothetical protein